MYIQRLGLKLRAVKSRATGRKGFSAKVTAVALTLFIVGVFPSLSDNYPELQVELQPGPPSIAVDYRQDVRPVLDRRCVVCHACYDAPCQLKLSSYEGISRGASKQAVYDMSRLKPVDPTRLFIDASSTPEWRRKGFFSVLGPPTDADDKQQLTSLLLRMIEQGHEHPFPEGQKLPESVDLDISRKLSCPAAEEFDGYAKKNPGGGMPYGIAPLGDGDYQTLLSWARQGAPGAQIEPALSDALGQSIQRWETLLNGQTAKQQLAARYVYEHLFLAHLYFEDSVASPYFRLVRSRTPPGQPVAEIATRHPNSPPGLGPFFYRLRPIASTIVHKTHMVYPLSEAKLARVEALLFVSEWDVEKLPGYDARIASNPFVTFAAIPPRSRYEFLLDNARYVMMAFIRGPVCRGQVALNVIDDHFFVAFLDPDHDLSVTDPSYLARAKNLIKIPIDSASPASLLSRWKDYFSAHKGYLEFRENAYYRHDPEGRDNTLQSIWPGNAYNSDSFLTVFRHFDSASVLPGFVGEIPKKMLVLDYPILERIYYNLVVNFDVFSNVTHQLLTRLSMDYLRMEAEDITLDFLPPDKRHAERRSWYAGAEGQLLLFLAHKMSARQRGAGMTYEKDDPKTELVEKMIQHFPQLRDAPDFLNRCSEGNCVDGKSTTASAVETTLLRLTSKTGAFVRLMPDVSYLRVRGGVNGDRVFTILRNKAHSNVAFIFGEERRRREKDDTLSAIEGFVGSYPNFFFQIDAGRLNGFADSLLNMKNGADFERIVEAFGIRRTSAEFWAASDWFNSQFARVNPKEAGLLDLNRYGNF